MDQLPLERDIQAYLAANLSSLGEMLVLVGTEYKVSFGRIDILAKDTLNSLVAIELKLGTATRDAIGQLQSYMGALETSNPHTFVRGILVATALDSGAKAALRMARDIQFVSYVVTYQFKTSTSAPSSYNAWKTSRESLGVTQTKNIWLPPNFKR